MPAQLPTLKGIEIHSLYMPPLIIVGIFLVQIFRHARLITKSLGGSIVFGADFICAKNGFPRATATKATRSSNISLLNLK